jgi:hypothetical protein
LQRAVTRHRDIKALLYDLLFKVSAETMLAIAADPKHPDIRLPSQIVRQLMEFDADRRSFVSRFTGAPLVGPARPQSTNSPAALKSP